jgi:apolipoprotein N-acyltransferase
MALLMGLYKALWAYLALTAINLSSQTTLKRLIGPALGAFLWLAFDWWQNILLTGFNWTPLAGSLSGCLPLLGLSDILGVYGLGFLVALISLLIASVLFSKLDKKAAFLQIGIVLFLLASLWGYGRYRLAYYDGLSQEAEKVRVVLLQGSVPQDVKWDPNFRDEVLKRYSKLVTQARDQKPWLIVWPETALPFIYGLDIVETQWLKDLLDQSQDNYILGLASAQYDISGSLRLYNRAQLTKGADFGAYYDKEHLVPFGEYIPLKQYLPILDWPFFQNIIGAAGAYSPGRRKAPMELDEQKFSLLICYESIFPSLSRQKVLDGSQFLVITTNDAWFGGSAAPLQHLRHAVLRAVENRRPVARAANNGLSALILPSGRIVNQTKQDEITIVSLDLPLIAPNKLPLTFFVSFGHFLAPIAAAAALIYLMFTVITEWRIERQKNRLAKKRNSK